MGGWFDDYMKQMNPNYQAKPNPYAGGDWRSLLTVPLTGGTYDQFAAARDQALNQQAQGGLNNSVLANMFSQLMSSIQKNAPRIPDESEMLAQATRLAGSQYDPQISAIRREMGLQKKRAGRNRRELGSLYGGLAASYGEDVSSAAKQSKADMAAEKRRLSDLENTLAADYHDSASAQESELNRMGLGQAIPDTTAGQDKDLAYLDKLAAVQGKEDLSALAQQGSAEQSYYREGRGIAQLEGSNAQRDLMAQLSDYLQGRQGDITGLEGQRASAIEQLRMQLNQQATDKMEQYNQTSWDQMYKLMNFMQGQQGQAKQYTRGLLGAGQVLKDQLGPTNAESISSIMQQLLQQQPFREGRYKGPDNKYINLSPEQAASYASTYADQQGLNNVEKLALVQAILAYYGRMGG